MKDKSLHKLAEQLYVQDFLNLEEVAKRIGVNERTIRRWRDKDDWFAKRKAYINKHSNIKQDLFNLSRQTFENIKKDMENGNNINTARLYQMLNLLDAMFKKERTEQILALYKNKEPSASEPKIDFDKLINEEFLKMMR